MLNVTDTAPGDVKGSLINSTEQTSRQSANARFRNPVAIESFLSHKNNCDGLGFLFVYSITSRTSFDEFTSFKNRVASLTIDGEVTSSFPSRNLSLLSLVLLCYVKELEL